MFNHFFLDELLVDPHLALGAHDAKTVEETKIPKNPITMYLVYFLFMMRRYNFFNLLTQININMYNN